MSAGSRRDGRPQTARGVFSVPSRGKKTIERVTRAQVSLTMPKVPGYYDAFRTATGQVRKVLTENFDDTSPTAYSDAVQCVWDSYNALCAFNSVLYKFLNYNNTLSGRAKENTDIELLMNETMYATLGLIRIKLERMPSSLPIIGAEMDAAVRTNHSIFKHTLNLALSSCAFDADCIPVKSYTFPYLISVYRVTQVRIAADEARERLRKAAEAEEEEKHQMMMAEQADRDLERSRWEPEPLNF